MANDKTIREALITQLLEDSDELVTKLEEVSKEIKKVSESIPSYFEQASNEVADILKIGVEADLQNAKKMLEHTSKEARQTIELQRRLNAQLSAITKQISFNKMLPVLIFIAAFAGGFAASFINILLK